MPRGFLEAAYFLTYCLYLIGASKSFRENGSNKSVLIMGLAVTTNVLISLLAASNLSFFQVNWGGTNVTMQVFGIVGVVFVWILFPLTLVFWKLGKTGLFHFFITLIEVCWFSDMVLFMYGLYSFPLKH